MAIDFTIDDNNISLETSDDFKTLETNERIYDLDLQESGAVLETDDGTEEEFDVTDYIKGGGGGSSDYNDLDNKPSINGVELIGDKSADDLSLGLVKNLGTFDLEQYDWDFWEYMADKTESGFYKVLEEQDGFWYFFRIERAGDMVYQEYWYTEENPLTRLCRYGYFTGDAWEWSDATALVTDDELYGNFYGKWQTYNKSEVNNLLANKADNSALNNYYTIEEVDELLEEFAPENMIETTWAELLELRDNGELTKGAYYRITDYEFITTKANVQSGGHQFDIILLAISESMLSESGYAARHAGDHYFEREITTGGIEWLYTLYADYMADDYGDEPTDHADDLHSTDVFCDSDILTHPVTGDDVPVLYKTDAAEYDFDDPDYDDAFFFEGVYDFDGDEYDLWSKYEFDGDDWVFMYQYALTPVVVEDGELIVSPIPETKMVPVNMNAWELKYCLDNDKELFDWAATEGKGVIYYMKDEFGNEAPYDFKNAKFQRKNITRTDYTILNGFLTGELSRIGLPTFYGIACGATNYYYYTFDTPGNPGNDSSLFGESANNVIKPYLMEGQRLINNIVLGYANANNFGLNCRDLSIWNGVQNNDFLKGCYNLLFSTASLLSAEGTHDNTFYAISNCKIGYNANHNVGHTFSDSEIGNGCINNNFGMGGNSNKLGSGCSGNTFGNYCYGNILADAVQSCQFANYVSYNEIGRSASAITLPQYTRYCKFETAVSRITFTTAGGNYSSQLQYITVQKGVTNLSAAPTRNRAYETIYYKAGRTEVQV